ncbi:hypothetical protein P4V41_13395 [Fictibacillus nanhaiensis]|uniref:hypothetical protein n=1 Tax=Fictibacillus nanhaiensis TaxID=742169 RepID=UPI002E1D1B1D|nr:hypothetical protein [Fictibacillus nanhaiensis]
MNRWKQAFSLSKFELTQSKKSIFTLLFLLVPYSYFLTAAISSYLEGHFMLYDIFFLLTFGVAAIWAKPKKHQYQKLSDNMWAQPFTVFLNQLPIPKDIVVRSRFLIYFIYSVPFHLTVLIIMYSFAPELRQTLPPLEFIAFSLIWLSFGICYGSVYPASDSGDKVTNVKMAFYAFVLLGSFTLLLFAVPYLSSHGLVGLTILVASKWPIVTSVVSIIAACASVAFWMRYMKNHMNKLDYFQ